MPSKLYDLIKKDLDTIEEVKYKKDLKSLLQKAEATNRVYKVYNSIKNLYVENYPNNIVKNLDDDFNNAEMVFSELENGLEDDVDALVLQFKDEERLDLSNLDNPNMDSYSYYSIVNASLNKTLSDYYKNMNPNAKNFEAIPNDLLAEAQKEVSNAYKKESTLENAEKAEIEAFIKNPSKQYSHLKVEPKKNVDIDLDKEESIDASNNVMDILDDSVEINEISENEQKYLDLIDEDQEWQSRDLAPKILEIIRKYDKDRVDFVSKNPGKADEFPTLGVFINNLRNKVVNIATYDEGLDLGSDKNGEFVKRFLDDPIRCINIQLDNQIKALEDANILDNVYLVDEETLAQNEKIININNAFKERLNADVQKYNRLNANKPNLWKEHQNLKANWFNKIFNNKMKQSIEEALTSNKGGFFENLFNTTSKEFKALKAGLNQMMDDGVEKGDLDGLGEKAEKYLLHKLKSYDSLNNTYDKDEFEKLDATSKGRVRLCINVVESVNESQKAIIKGLNVNEYPGNAQKINETVKLDTFDFLNAKDDDQLDFQEKINKEINNEQKDIDNDNIKENEMNNELEK